MKRLALFALCVLAAGSLWAQPINTQTTVKTGHPLAAFQVDGNTYVGQATFTWPEGSVHYLRFLIAEDLEIPNVQLAQGGTTRFIFQKWEASAGDNPFLDDPAVVILADRKISTYTALHSVEFLGRLRFWPAGDPQAACTSPGAAPPEEYGPGVVFIDGQCFSGNADMWFAPGTHSLMAFPYPGSAFIGWGINDQDYYAFLRTFEVTNVVVLTPKFVMAKRIRFSTDPPGLQVLLDRTPIQTPEEYPCPSWHQLPVHPPPGVEPLCFGEVDWAVGSQHVIGAPTPQHDGRNGMDWVFDGFSNGMGNHEVYIPSNLEPETIVAHFTRGGRVSFVTTPTQLELSINGRTNWPAYNFVARAGDEYELSAPEEQTGPDGRRYRFVGWSNGGTATQRVTMPANVAEDGFRLTANYELLGQVMITSDPTSLVFEVDGANCTTPCFLNGEPGAEFTVAPPAGRSISHNHRQEFANWSDGAPRERVVTVQGTDRVTVRANYTTMYLLESESYPASGATIQLTPPSSDGFYPKGTYVSVTAEANKGYRFRRWVGDLESVYHTGAVTMSVPRTITAMMDETDEVGEAYVRSAAGELPEMVAAAGSIISIYSASQLAPFLAVADSNPLPQTLAGVTVMIHDRILVLLFTSEGQINAVLPYDLAPGEYTIIVKRTGKPDVTGKVTLVRNAPGIFTRTFNGQAFVLASHEDGTPVTPDSPARRDEVITIYGTGFGPFEMNYPYGFLLASAPEYVLADPVELFAGDIALQPESATGAPGYAGTEMLKLRIGDDLPQGVTVEFRARSGGRDSNTAFLPLE